MRQVLDTPTRTAEHHLATIEQHGLVLPMCRQPVRPVHLFDLHMAPDGVRPLCERCYALRLLGTGDLGEFLAAAGASFLQWPVEMNCVGPALDAEMASCLRVQVWLPDTVVPAVPPAFWHLFPYGTALYRRWPRAGTQGEVMIAHRLEAIRIGLVVFTCWIALQPGQY